MEIAMGRAPSPRPIFTNKFSIFHRFYYFCIRKVPFTMKRKHLFCELGPTAYAISLNKQIITRKIRNLISDRRLARLCEPDPAEGFPAVVYAHRSSMIKRGPGIDMQLQLNKVRNIALACSRIDGVVIRPGETFSFWHLVGRTSRANGFAPGRVLANGRLVAGVGGGLCNLANTLHILFMHSPLTVVELHHHSAALVPDPGGVRIPYSAGTSVNYNFLDLRFRNDTDRPVRLLARCEGDDLVAELRTTRPFSTEYRIVEENHHFHLAENGSYYRLSRIYRETVDRATGRILARKLKWDNRSRVMFDPALLPADQIR